VVLGGTSIVVPPHKPFALVLSAAAGAGLLALVARRTGKQAFVWTMLACVTLAYNFSPVFFLEAARALVDHGAHLVQEERLPYAFYGLSYLPLLVGLVIVSARAERKGSRLFALPLRRYSFAVSCVLLAVSLTHGKAMFPVGVAMLAMFAAQARLFQRWYAALAGVAAFLIAAYGIPVFAGEVLALPVPAEAHVCCLA